MSPSAGQCIAPDHCSERGNSKDDEIIKRWNVHLLDKTNVKVEMACLRMNDVFNIYLQFINMCKSTKNSYTNNNSSYHNIYYNRRKRYD